ncbi:high mobility group box domain-containing protein [Stachybotrys elegans]|uniref:High mobility group box domain-containing protein n=1 Tax=Stachybotrys elegans TaxID=80388 RepID=A0A8K0WM45_9HYPO|nr:high mobility group box domain-containing protein [Stachybotrys elegans]
MSEELANHYRSIYSPSELEEIWRTLEVQIHPFTQVITLEDKVVRRLDEPAKRFLAHKFMSHVMQSVMFVCDGTSTPGGTNNKRWFLGPPKFFTAGGGMVIKVNGGDAFWAFPSEARIQTATVPMPILPPTNSQVRVPRPPNAYILYRKERHTLVKSANPDITNNEISQILGRAWNMESKEVRDHYKEMAEDVKRALLEKHPDYQYRPRRPNEKRKRSRRSTRSRDDANSHSPRNGNIADTSTGDEMEAI